MGQELFAVAQIPHYRKDTSCLCIYQSIKPIEGSTLLSSGGELGGNCEAVVHARVCNTTEPILRMALCYYAHSLRHQKYLEPKHAM
jgi:hypothetical protein